MGSAALTHAVLGQGPKIQRYMACHLQWPGRKRISRRELETRLSWECLSPAKPAKLYPHLSQNAQNLQMSCAQNHIKKRCVSKLGGSTKLSSTHLPYSNPRKTHCLGHLLGGMVLGAAHPQRHVPTADPLVIDLGAEMRTPSTGRFTRGPSSPAECQGNHGRHIFGHHENIPLEQSKKGYRILLDIQ